MPGEVHLGCGPRSDAGASPVGSSASMRPSRTATVWSLEERPRGLHRGDPGGVDEGVDFAHGVAGTKNPAGAGFSAGFAGAYFLTPLNSMSTRRFFWRPSFVLLVATGCDSPLPRVVIFEAGMPLETRYSFTAAARRSESFWL